MDALKILSFLAILLLAGNLGYAQTDSLNKPTLKLGHRIYLKTEVLNSLARMALSPETFDVDVQGSIMITNKFHWVNTYGKATFNIVDSLASTEREGFVNVQKRTGTSLHRSSSMLRYYPFETWKSAKDFLFVEGGVHFQHYTGATESVIRDSLFVTESQFEQRLDFFRYGPQINVGISMRFDDWDIYDLKKPKRRVTFSPEALIGVMYNQLHIVKNEYEQIIGVTEIEDTSYSEPKLRLTLRAKVGIGIF